MSDLRLARARSLRHELSPDDLPEAILGKRLLPWFVSAARQFVAREIREMTSERLDDSRNRCGIFCPVNDADWHHDLRSDLGEIPSVPQSGCFGPDALILLGVQPGCFLSILRGILHQEAVRFGSQGPESREKNLLLGSLCPVYPRGELVVFGPFRE